MPNFLHAALQWNHSNPFPIKPVTEDSPWTVINTTKKNELIDQHGAIDVKHELRKNVTSKCQHKVQDQSQYPQPLSMRSK